MSYTIDYSPEKRKRYPDRTEKKGIVMPILLLLVLIAVAGMFVIKNQPLITQCYFDGLDMLSKELMTGTKIGQTVSLYCSQLFEYAAVG